MLLIIGEKKLRKHEEPLMI